MDRIDTLIRQGSQTGGANTAIRDQLTAEIAAQQATWLETHTSSHTP